MPGLTIDQWGPGAWNTLHTFAHRAPLELTDQDREQWTTFLRLFTAFLPCPKCRVHFADFLDRRLQSDALSTRKTLVALLNDAHNEVNARNGKRVFSLDEHYAAYRRPRPVVVRARDAACFAGVAVAAALLLGAGAAEAARARKRAPRDTLRAFDASLRALM
jgi:hypothetical protein